MEIGMILGAFALGVLLFRPLSGFVTDKKSRKLALVMGVFIFFITPVFYLFSTSFYYLLFIRFFHGIGITFYTTAFPTLVTDIVPDSRRGEMLGHMATATTLSFALGPFAGVALFTGLGFQAVVVTCLLIGFMNLIVILLIQEKSNKRDYKTGTLYRKAIFNRSVLLSSFIQIVNAVIFGGVMTFLPIFLTKAGLNVGIFFLVESCTIILCRISAAHLSDRFGRGPVFFYSFVIVLLAVFLISKITSMYLLITTAVLFGTGSALSSPTLSAFIADETTPLARGMVFGFFYGAFDLGVIISGVILGYVSDLTSIEEMFASTAFTGFLALILFAAFIRKGIVKSLGWTLVGTSPERVKI